MRRILVENAYRPRAGKRRPADSLDEAFRWRPARPILALDEAIGLATTDSETGEAAFSADSRSKGCRSAWHFSRALSTWSYAGFATASCRTRRLIAIFLFSETKTCSRFRPTEPFTGSSLRASARQKRFSCAAIERHLEKGAYLEGLRQDAALRAWNSCRAIRSRKFLEAPAIPGRSTRVESPLAVPAALVRTSSRQIGEGDGHRLHGRADPAGAAQVALKVIKAGMDSRQVIARLRPSGGRR